MSSTNLPLATPDFDENKRRLKEFLRSQDELKDYDFEGSTLSVLLDVLAYNSHMNAFFLNMVANEAFLSTAIRRANVVANAKDLGYVPTSAKSASTSLYLEYEAVGAPATSITLPEGTAFGASSSGVSYIFSTIDDYLGVWDSDKQRYVVESAAVYEGRRFEHVFTVVPEGSSISPDTVYDVTHVGVSVPNMNADSSTMRVYVNDPSIAIEYVLYSQYDGTLGIDSKSNVYFTSEDELGRVNIKFGDNILGRKPAVGSKIKVVYIVSSGPAANGVALFNQTTAVQGAKLSTVVAYSPAGGGSYPESIESIKFNAPLSFEAQDRGVLADDYAYLVRRVYPNAKSVVSWGGQDNDPPIFGKVFVSVQPKDGVILTQTDKDSITAYLTKKGVMTIRPEIVDPDYILVDVVTRVRYAANQSSVIGGALETIVAEKIREYSTTVLSIFKSNLEFSRFVTAIDASDPGIKSNVTSISLAKRVFVNYGTEQQATVRFSNALRSGSVTSTRFTYGSFTNCRFGSIGENGLAIYSEQAGNTLTIVSDIGSVDYETGTVTINPFIVDDSDPLYFDVLVQRHFVRITAQAVSQNIETKKNQIIQIDNITVTSEKV